MLDERRVALNQAIEELYNVFKSYPRLEHIDGCPCCTTEEDQQLLHSAPLGDLRAAELESFSFKAMTTWGRVSDFKHFLPRILELAAEGDVGNTDIEVVFGKFDYARWKDWPAHEQKAVERYLVVLWQDVLVRPTCDYPCLDVGDFLCAIACAQSDIRPFLDIWRADSSLQSIINLYEFLTENINSLLTKHRLRNEFWPRDATEQVKQWLESSDLSRTVETAFFRFQSTPSAEKISSLVTMLEALRTTAEARRGSSV